LNVQDISEVTVKNKKGFFENFCWTTQKSLARRTGADSPVPADVQLLEVALHKRFVGQEGRVDHVLAHGTQLLLSEIPRKRPYLKLKRRSLV
jgi:hypothetical protein